MSVIMPVYNEMPHLREALESALAQDMRDLELIVVDDGSTDGSGELLDDFAERDDRVTVLHERNSGWPGTPRNRDWIVPAASSCSSWTATTPSIRARCGRCWR
ncbi:glycosyltransferase family 2 protein [Microbacterium sp. NIBRBAC000506063]|uniref:glycosyltransferase family 2 protein n=1 Tax=Microbacterium sp. NIBRBAC000506063 TaxID=2734618 RepID=UPI001BB58A6E|nr:glycosyltransferase family A protein [Microbacterium sp. NIBRBAC000506063]QTV79712.1 glycosyltransferase family 2 protein [Microbacterium sp. NIBRBAC000506063]